MNLQGINFLLNPTYRITDLFMKMICILYVQKMLATKCKDLIKNICQCQIYEKAGYTQYKVQVHLLSI
jgi:hypothetical protein